VAGRRAQVGAAAVLFAVSLNVAACSGSPTSLAASAPPGWKVSHDASGTCEVSAPSAWVVGTDFHLEKAVATSAPAAGESGLRPPLDVWPSAWPTGDWYQLRTSVVRGSTVCSVWRAKPAAIFTTEEKAEMDSVGKTLKVLP
jgi:hypothetical protein